MHIKDHSAAMKFLFRTYDSAASVKGKWKDEFVLHRKMEFDSMLQEPVRTVIWLIELTENIVKNAEDLYSDPG